MKYDLESEKKWMEYWETKNVYKFDEKSNKEIYAIDTPPPTVSGKMHIGHAFSYTHKDIIARSRRMLGFNVYYPFGTDDNGLPTKLLIEKIKKVRATDMDRKEFVKLCLDTLAKELRPRYIKDMKRLGISCDFSKYYSTIDEHSQKISQKSFIDLYKMGREYRVEAPAMWCPKCRTAISQVECEDKELESYFNDIVFKVDEENLVVATTRPELLPACVAVFYHPEDERYKKYEGKKATVPLFNFEVPIIADERADPEKGTGIVMCCTFGDSTDAEWQKAHNLPIKEAFGKDGRMTAISGKYEGMKIEEARKEIIIDMKESGLLLEQKNIKHDVNVHERCGTPIEWVHSKQWFVKYLDLKEDMLKWGEELNWYPAFMKNRYDNWVKGLQWDWCISRQLPFGVPFPVWYCKKCDEVILAEEEQLPVDPLIDKPKLEKCKCGCSEFVPEKDIINTWATSSLTPVIAAKLVPNMFDKIFPMTLRPQAHDIITFWLFNTVVKSQLHYGKNPFKDCVISGWILDPKGKKMSKSKGNVIEPEVMINKYGADSLRFMAAGVKLGEDLPFQEKDMVTAKKLVTKMINASKFAAIHLEGYENKEYELTEYDKAFMSRLHKVIKSCRDAFMEYDYSKAKRDVEKFFWYFCDNYLEISKDRLYNPDKRSQEEKESAQYCLHNGLSAMLKLFAPIMPFITEELYQKYQFAEGRIRCNRDREQCSSVHLSLFPKYDESMINESAEKAAEIMDYAVEQARKAKSEANISLKEPIKEFILQGKIDLEHFEKIKNDLIATTKTEKMEYELINDDSEVEIMHTIRLE